MVSMNLLKNKLLNKIGKGGCDEEPEEYTVNRKRAQIHAKYLSKLNKRTKSYAQKAENSTNLLYRVGDFIVQKAIEEGQEDAEINVKIGEFIKSTAEIQHSMLIRLIETVVIPAREYTEYEKSAVAIHRKYVDSSISHKSSQKKDADTLERKRKAKEELYEEANKKFKKLNRLKEMECNTADLFNSFKGCFEDALALAKDIEEDVKVFENKKQALKQSYIEEKERRAAEKKRRESIKVELDQDMVDRLSKVKKSLPTLPSHLSPASGSPRRPSINDNSTEAILARMRAEKERIEKERASKNRAKAQSILQGNDNSTEEATTIPLDDMTSSSSPPQSLSSSTSSQYGTAKTSQSDLKARPLPPRPRSNSKRVQKPTFKAIGGAISSYTYEANESGELSFGPGEYLICFTHEPDGWGTAILLDSHDQQPKEYPATYVEQFSKAQVTKMLYDYKGEDDGFEVKQGQYINVLLKGEGWWLGETVDGYGFFPSTYCELGSE